MSLLGPLDRRVLRKRCVACARRKIKCDGGPPCLYCIKRKFNCVPQVFIEKSEPVFINISFPSEARQVRSLAKYARSPHAALSQPQDKFMDCFFLDFLKRNNLGRNLDTETITSSFQSSPSLYNSIVALGAFQLSLDFSQVEFAKKSRIVALKAYRSSIISFQTEIEDGSVLQSECNLYTTLFLGLFELMFDVTGEGWVKHILYGTSKLLQLRGPDAHLNGRGRSFFMTMRVFEICRSLIYSEPTFLAERGWTNLTRQIREELGTTWQPKETLFDLMIACSSLSWRVWQVLKHESAYSIQSCILNGHRLRTELNQWYADLQTRSKEPNTGDENYESLLAIIYFHAISIFLSGIFDYRYQFYQGDCPTLSQTAIQAHVDAILLQTQAALATTNLAGVLFFFPLRVAGARVTQTHETKLILGMLHEVSTRGFVVADAFVSELREVWNSKEIDSL